LILSNANSIEGCVQTENDEQNAQQEANIVQRDIDAVPPHQRVHARLLADKESLQGVRSRVGGREWRREQGAQSHEV
jgi:hypothetical protein